MGKTLYLECRGCDFWKHDDIGQYSDPTKKITT